MQPHGNLHALSGAGVHGGQHAGTVNRRLREVVSTNRDSFREHATKGSRPPVDPDSAACGVTERRQSPIDSTFIATMVTLVRFSQADMQKKADFSRRILDNHKYGLDNKFA